jgi:hypothetical protein
VSLPRATKSGAGGPRIVRKRVSFRIAGEADSDRTEFVRFSVVPKLLTPDFAQRGTNSALGEW